MGIYYGSSSGKTESVAMRIFSLLGKERSVVRDVADSTPKDFLDYKILILGIPTWGIGELQDDWEDFLPGLEELDLSDKTVALFGLGDQESYPDTFADALGSLYDSMLSTGCGIIGNWPVRGYEFTESAAVRDGKFAGLILDEENQSQLTDERIKNWLREIIPGLAENLKD